MQYNRRDRCPFGFIVPPVRARVPRDVSPKPSGEAAHVASRSALCFCPDPGVFIWWRSSQVQAVFQHSVLEMCLMSAKM